MVNRFSRRLQPVALALGLSALMPLAARAQNPPPKEFPPEATALSADAAHQRLSGKVFTGTSANGVEWRLEYKANGYAFFNNSRRGADSGKWKLEGEKLCVQWQRSESGCGELRFTPEALYVQRASNGEVLKLVTD